MQEAKKSMSSLNLVFFLPILQVTTCTLFYGPILYNKMNTSYGADHTATDSLCIYMHRDYVCDSNHIICKKIMHSLLLPYCEIKIYKNSYVTPTLHNNVHILL